MARDTFTITPENLREYGANGEDIAFIQERYPQGVSFYQILSDEVVDISMDLIHWGFMYLPLSDTDKEMYLDYVEITDSSHFASSYNIHNCRVVVDSIFCTNSRYVIESSHVKDSSFIFNGEDINEGYQVYDSRLIKSSDLVSDSQDVTCSVDVLYSNGVIYSSSIAFSTEIEGSSLLVECEAVENSYLSRNLISCKNKILCYDLENNSEYMVLNERVSEEFFETLREALSEFWDNKYYFVKKIEEEEIETATGTLRIINNLLEPRERVSWLLLKEVFDENPKLLRKIKRSVKNLDLNKLYQLSLSSKVFS